MPDEIQIGHRFITPNVVEFWVENLPHDCLCKCPKRFQQANYGYLWKFYDGGYSLSPNPIYEFDHTSQEFGLTKFIVKVEVHPKWTDDELSIVEGSIPIKIDTIVSVNEYQDDFIIPKGENEISITYNRNPVPGHHLTFILHYSGNVKGTGLSLFIPNKKLLNPVIQSFGLDLGGTISLFSSNNLGELEWNQNNTTKLGKNTSFVRVDVADNLDPTEPLDKLIDVLLQNNSMEVPLNLSLANSFDPNKKTVSPTQISESSQIKVTIDFQNIGEGPTDSITIIDKIHPLLDLNSFCFKSVQIGGNSIEDIINCSLSQPQQNSISYSINWERREITFTLDPAVLAGLGGLEAAADCAEDLTTGVLEYTISTVNLDAVPDSTSFGTKALIYFDTNGAIHTNPAYVQVNACAELSAFENCSYTNLYGNEEDNGIQSFHFDTESQRIATIGYNPHFGIINERGDIIDSQNVLATDIPNNFTDLLRTPNGDVITVGKTPTVPEDYFVLRGGEDGITWAKTYDNGNKRDHYPRIVQSNGDTYIIAGWWLENDLDDLQLIKINGNGDVEWSKTYEMGKDDQLRGVCSNGEGGLVAVGEISDPTMPAFVIEVDSMGNVIQNKEYNTTVATNPAMIPREMIRTKDGNYVMIGEIFSNTPNSSKNGFIAKLDKNTLDTIWVKEFLGGSDAMILRGLTQDEDENYYMTGYFKITSDESELIVVKCDSEGNFLWAKKLADGYGSQIFITPNQELIVAGITENFHSGFGGADAFLTKTDTSLNSCITEDIPNTPISHTWQVFDGPATPATTTITTTNVPVTIEEYTTQELELCNTVCTNGSFDQTICFGESVPLEGTFFEDATYQWTTEAGDSIGNGQNIIVAPTETTHYFLTINHLLGCETIDEIIIYVDENPSCCIEDMITINQYTGVIPPTINQTTEILPGVSLTPQLGQFYEILPDSACNTLIVDPLIEGEKTFTQPIDEKNEEVFRVYPNPFRDEITIEYNLKESTSVNIVLYDITGKIVKELLIDEYQEKAFYQIKAKLCNLPEGTYICHIRMGASILQSIKLIKS